MSLEKLRNIGIIAHIDAGKTTFSERILFYTNEIHRMGEVHEGAATMDFMPEEQEHGITIASACTTCAWNDKIINLVDTPGHVDFTVEVERSLRVLDAAIGIFCAVGGVEPQSETVWKQADAFGIPRIAVVNKMDRVGADFSLVLQSMQERLHVLPLALSIPLGEGADFTGVLDLISSESVIFDQKSQGREVLRQPFTQQQAKEAAPWQEKIFDALTTYDDKVLELVMAGKDVPPTLLQQSVRKGVLVGKFVPVFAASALKNIGVQLVLDAIDFYLPSPLDIKNIFAEDSTTGKKVEIFADANADLCGLVFKVMVENKRKVSFVRLYSGTLKSGDSIYNSSKQTHEKVHHLYQMHADRKEPLEKAKAGDIIAIIGFKNAQTGDTFTSFGRQVLLEPLRTWQPVIALAFEPKNQEDALALDEALAVFCIEDPTLRVEQDVNSGQRLVSGMGELHLEIVKERLKREFGLTPRVGNPQVVYRETLAKLADGFGLVDKALGEQWHYGYVGLEVAPAARGSGLTVSFAENLAMLTEPLRQQVTNGIYDAASCGASGYPLEDIAIMVTALEEPNIPENFGKTTPQGLYMAAQMALRKATEKSVLLEPLMQVIITVPDSFLGAVMNLLGGHEAKIEKIEERGAFGVKEVVALAPMRELFGFSTYLRSATQGRAGLVMSFARFDRLT